MHCFVMKRCHARKGAGFHPSTQHALTCKERDDQADKNDGCFRAVRFDDRSGQPGRSHQGRAPWWANASAGERRVLS